MKKSKYSRNDLTKLFAFCALILAAVIWLLAAVGVRITVLTFIKDIALLLAITLPAYSFAKSLGKTWVIVFWVIFIIFSVALVFGSFPIL